MIKQLLLFIYLGLTLFPISFSQIKFIKDPNPDLNTAPAFPSEFFSWKGHVYFSATVENIYGLWRTDGTSEGTELIKNNLNVYQIVPFGDKLAFAGYEKERGTELWISDGTPAGTQRVKDIVGGPNSSDPRNLVSLHDKIIFSAKDSQFGNELWISDGTEDGTQMIKDLETGSEDSKFDLLLAGDSLVFFVEETSDFSFQIGKTDGTPQGTEVYFSFGSQGLYEASDESFVVHQDHLYFFGQRDSLYGIWKSDGTPSGTRLLVSLPQKASEPRMALMQDHIYMLVGSPSMGNEGSAIFKTDGSQWNLELIKDFQNKNMVFMAAGTEKIFSGGYEELWASDGTANGTVRFLSIHSFNTSLAPIFASGQYAITMVNYRLLFTDGTPENTKVIDLSSQGMPSGPRVHDAGGFAFIDNKVIFSACPDDQSQNHEPWISDGTLAGTQQITDIASLPPSAKIEEIFLTPNAFYFPAKDTLGVELWKSDGTTEGTFKVRDIYPGEDSSFPNEFELLNGITYFSAGTRDINGLFLTQLWRTDGTEENTYRVAGASLANYNSHKSFSKKYAWDSTLFFAGGTPYNNQLDIELWTSDGCDAGTFELKEINPNDPSISVPFHAHPSAFTALNDKLLFVATNKNTGFEWWETDGSSIGTKMLKDISPGNSDGILASSGIIRLGDTVFFAAKDPDHGLELWYTDGTREGTRLFMDVNPGPESSGPLLHGTLNGELIFSTFYNLNDQLWITDKAAGITQQIHSITPIIQKSMIKNCEGCHAVRGGVIVFPARGGPEGNELWRTDGTPQGTWLIADIYPDPWDSNPRDFVHHKDTLYFIADGPDEHSAIYQTDGHSHIQIARSSQIGDSVINPRHLFAFDDKLFLLGDHPEYGESLYEFIPGGKVNEDTTIVQPPVNERISIFPNPAKNSLTVEVEHAQQGFISLWAQDIQGRMIIFKSIRKENSEFKHEVNISEWAAGLYFFHIRLGSELRTEKIIIE